MSTVLIATVRSVHDDWLIGILLSFFAEDLVEAA